MAALVPPTPEEEMVWECGGNAGLTGSGVLQEPHLQHHASSTQRFHAGQGTGGVPEPFPSPLRRPQKSGEWGSREAAPLGAEPRCFTTGTRRTGAGQSQ